MNSNDYVKFITQTFVQYMEQPKSERKKQRIERKQEKAPVLFRWFGIVPYLLFYGMKGTKKEIINQQQSKNMNKTHCWVCSYFF